MSLQFAKILLALQIEAETLDPFLLVFTLELNLQHYPSGYQEL